MSNFSFMICFSIVITFVILGVVDLKSIYQNRAEEFKKSLKISSLHYSETKSSPNLITQIEKPAISSCDGAPISQKIHILGINLTHAAADYLRSDFLKLSNWIELTEITTGSDDPNYNVNPIIYAAMQFNESCPRHELYGVIVGNTYFNPRTLNTMSSAMNESSFLIIDENRLDPKKDKLPVYAAFMNQEAMLKLAQGATLFTDISQQMGYGMQFVHFIASQNETVVSIYETKDIREAHPPTRQPCDLTSLIAIRDLDQKFSHTQTFLIWVNSPYNCRNKLAQDFFRPLRKASKFDCHCS